MGGWVKDHVHYGLPMARLYVTAEEYRGGSVAEGIARLLDTMGDDPAAMEEYLAGLIRTYRPELAGGSLAAVRFDFERACWEFLYIHPSLPRGVDGMERERIPLVPSEVGDNPWRDKLGPVLSGILTARTPDKLAAAANRAFLPDVPGWAIKVNRDSRPRCGHLTSPALVGAGATIGNFTGPLVAYDEQYDQWWEIGEAVVTALSNSAPDGGMVIEAETVGDLRPTISPESAASARAAGFLAGYAAEKRVMNAVLAAGGLPALDADQQRKAVGCPVTLGVGGEVVGYVQKVDEKGRADIYFPDDSWRLYLKNPDGTAFGDSADPDAPHVVTATGAE